MNYKELKESNKRGIHEVLFQMNIIELEDDDKVEEYYTKLPDNIKMDGVHWGFPILLYKILCMIGLRKIFFNMDELSGRNYK